jgi:thiamine transporter ThiT
MKKVNSSILAGAAIGMSAGAVVLGLWQYVFELRHSSIRNEIGSFVLTESVLGALLGASFGAFAGLLIGLLKTE